LFMLYPGTESAITYHVQNPRLVLEFSVFCGRLNLASDLPTTLKYHALAPSNKLSLKQRSKFGLPTYS